MVKASADVCPASERILAFAKDDGSVARMAVVRPPLTTPSPTSLSAVPSNVGRYVVGPKIAAGGMASVHLGRLRGSAGFARTVAIKRLLPALAQDPEFVARFVDEARIASRVRHANVVPTLDVVDVPEVLLVLEYIHGESLARLLRLAAARDRRCPPNVASAIVIGILRGLHVAHDAKGSNGVPLELVHRDVSPQNVLVGIDGVARVLDFGIAKAAGREQSTLQKGSTHDLRGKLAYMAPEQLSGEPLDRRADIFAAGVMLWETLAGDRLFKGEDAMTTMEAIFHRDAPRLSAGIANVSARLDEVLATALAKDASQRFATADEMARAIELALPPGSDREVAEWVDAVACEILSARTALIARFEGSTESGEEHEPVEATTERRAALFPPELPNARPPDMGAGAGARDEAKTLPGVDVPVPATDAEPLRTPMSMVAPLTEAHDPLAQSGMSSTRIDPIDLDARRSLHSAYVPASSPVPPRTPIPMPMPEAKKRGLSFGRLAALVLTPPAVAAIALLVIRPITSARAAANANATADAPMAATADPPPPIPPPLPVAPAPPPVTVAKVVAASPPASSAWPSSPRARSPRERWLRPPRKR